MNVTIATRGSKLALIQADLVKKRLEAHNVHVTYQIVRTRGDKDKTSPISRIGGRGLFVKEVENTLLSGQADIAVHSGKDLPYELAEGLMIGGTPPAGDSRDVLIIRKDVKDIKTIGTGSARRIIECQAFYPDASYQNIRGNVDTRLSKLKAGHYDAIILAKAGLDRLGADLSDFNVQIFDPASFIPSACQGIIAIECRRDDTRIRSLLTQISDHDTLRRFQVERLMFTMLKADCQVPLGVYSTLDGETITLTAMLNGKKVQRTGREYQTLCKDIQQELLR